MLQTKSSWTPLVNKDANKALFAERKRLILAWFEKWSECQRKQLMISLFDLCTPRQLESLFCSLEDKLPLYQIDFTRTLPRVLCIYIFSFLDPRSLCRCAQVSWYWRYLTESNELWALKCLRYGWDLILSHGQLAKLPGLFIKFLFIFFLYYFSSTDNDGTLKKSSKKLLTRTPAFNSSYNRQNNDHHKDDYHNNISMDNNVENDLKVLNKHNKHILNNKSKSNHDQNKYNPIQLLMITDAYKTMPWRAPSRKPSDTYWFNYFDNDTMKLMSTVNQFKHRHNNSPRLMKHTLSSASNSHKFSQTDDIHGNSMVPRTHSPSEHETTLKSTYYGYPIMISHHSSIKIPWKPSSRCPSRSEQIQNSIVKRHVGRCFNLKISPKFIRKVQDNEQAITKLLIDNLKLSETNNHIGNENGIVGYFGNKKKE
ncbi:F-box only protein 16 [Schistosoma japonicum]|nr:F-box only protein 16 [Schistosoma japonicum]